MHREGLKFGPSHERNLLEIKRILGIVNTKSEETQIMSEVDLFISPIKLLVLSISATKLASLFA